VPVQGCTLPLTTHQPLAPGIRISRVIPPRRAQENSFFPFTFLCSFNVFGGSHASVLSRQKSVSAALLQENTLPVDKLMVV